MGLYIKGFRYAALKEGGERWWEFPFNKRLVKIFLYYLLVSFFVGLYVAIAGGISVAAYFFAGQSILLVSLVVAFFIVLGFYLFTRLMLIFLYVSIDQEKALRTSWHVMKGNVWHFILLVFFISLGVLVIGAVGSAVIGLLGFLAGLLSAWLGAVVLGFFVPFGLLIMLLSMAWIINAIAMVDKQLRAKK